MERRHAQGVRLDFHFSCSSAVHSALKPWASRGFREGSDAPTVPTYSAIRLRSMKADSARLRSVRSRRWSVCAPAIALAGEQNSEQHERLGERKLLAVRAMQAPNRSGEVETSSGSGPSPTRQPRTAPRTRRPGARLPTCRRRGRRSHGSSRRAGSRVRERKPGAFLERPFAWRLPCRASAGRAARRATRRRR